MFPSIYQPFFPKLFWECYSALVCEAECYFLLAREGLVESQAPGSLARASIRTQGCLGTKHRHVSTVWSITGESPFETRSLRLIGQVLISVSWYWELNLTSFHICSYPRKSLCLFLDSSREFTNELKNETIQHACLEKRFLKISFISSYFYSTCEMTL